MYTRQFYHLDKHFYQPVLADIGPIFCVASVGINRGWEDLTSAVNYIEINGVNYRSDASSSEARTSVTNDFLFDPFRLQCFPKA